MKYLETPLCFPFCLFLISLSLNICSPSPPTPSAYRISPFLHLQTERKYSKINFKRDKRKQTGLFGQGPLRPHAFSPSLVRPET